jgi:hypothetical protein
MRKRRESDYGYDGPSIEDGNSTKDRGDYNGITEIESGPSRITIDDLQRMEECALLSCSIPKSRPIRKGLAFGLALPFLTLAAAAPPFTGSAVATPTPSPTPTLYIRQESESLDEEVIDYDIQYLTSMSTPTQNLPTNVYVVAETRLPFYLSQDQQGSWTKVDNAWLLYGRQAGVGLSRLYEKGAHNRWPLRILDLTMIRSRLPSPRLTQAIHTIHRSSPLRMLYHQGLS